MKKIAILLVFTLGTFIVNAQSVVEGTKVTENDMWEFANVLKDLHFFAKGIIYYDDRVSSGAKKVAELTNIDLKKFDLLDEVIKSALSAIKVMLPDEEVIGDPFWVVMGTEQDSDKNTGNYEMVNDSILLFLSKLFRKYTNIF